VKALRDNSVSQTEIADFLDGYREWMQDEQKSLETFFEKTKVEFLGAVKRELAAGTFPALDIQKMERRLSELRPFISDPLDGSYHHVMYASYSLYYVRVAPKIVTERLDGFRRHVLFHEFVHATMCMRPPSFALRG